MSGDGGGMSPHAFERRDLVDPNVRKLAELFVDCTIYEVRGDAAVTFTQRREQLVQRAAKAMQQAIEDECAAIRKELMT
jgi:hypothetical protein